MRVQFLPGVPFRRVSSVEERESHKLDVTRAIRVPATTSPLPEGIRGRDYESRSHRLDSCSGGQLRSYSTIGRCWYLKSTEVQVRILLGPPYSPSITQPLARVPALNRRDLGSMPGRGANHCGGTRMA
jgi:hypothetical protein